MEMPDVPLVSEKCRQYCEEIRNGPRKYCMLPFYNISDTFNDVDLVAVLSVVKECPQVNRLEVLLPGLTESSRAIISDFLADGNGIDHVVMVGDPHRRVEQLPPSLLDAISRSTSIKSIMLKFCGMRNTAPSFPNFIRSTSSLKSLQLLAVKNDYSGASIEELERSCIANNSIEELECFGDFTPRLYSCLIRNLGRGLKKLSLNVFYDPAVVDSLLRQSQTLQELAFCQTEMSPQCCENLIEALRANRSLQKLNLRFGSVRSDALVLVGDMIRVSRSLESVHVQGFDEPSNVTLWDALTRGLEGNPGVREVSIWDVNNASLVGTLRHILLRLTQVKRLVLHKPHPRTLNWLADILSLKEPTSLVELKFEQCFGVESPLVSLVERGLLQNTTVKTFHIDTHWNDVSPDAVMNLMKQNFTLTDLSLGVFYRDKKAQKKKMEDLVARNLELERIDYGVQADPRIWPSMIHLVLSNEWRGPSLVFRLLTSRADALSKEED